MPRLTDGRVVVNVDDDTARTLGAGWKPVQPTKKAERKPQATAWSEK